MSQMDPHRTIPEPRANDHWLLVSPHGRAGFKVTLAAAGGVHILFSGESMGMTRAWWNTLAAAGLVEPDLTRAYGEESPAIENPSPKLNSQQEID